MSKLNELIKELCPDLPAGRQVGWNMDYEPTIFVCAKIAVKSAISGFVPNPIS